MIDNNNIYTPTPERGTGLVIVPEALDTAIDAKIAEACAEFPEMTDYDKASLRNTLLCYFDEYGRFPDCKIVKS